MDEIRGKIHFIDEFHGHWKWNYRRNNETETSEVLVKTTKENIFSDEDKNIPVRTCKYGKRSDGKNIMDGQKSSNGRKH